MREVKMAAMTEKRRTSKLIEAMTNMVLIRRAMVTDKPKELLGIPWRVAFALQADGWWLRSDIIWHKPNPMPESVTDRPTKSHEYVFLLTKSARYYYDADAIKIPSVQNKRPIENERIKPTAKNDSHTDKDCRNIVDPCSDPDGPNRRTVWTIATAPYSGAHFATYPPKLVEPCIQGGE